MKYLIALSLFLGYYNICFASNIYATIENGQIVYKNRPTFFSNVINNPNYKRSFIKDLLEKAAQKYGVNERFVLAIAMAESGLNHSAISNKGAIGVMQIIPSTASLLNINPYNLEQNIYGGVKYLKFLLDKYSGNYTLAAAAYNCGPNNVDKYNGVPPFAETINYVKTVMAYFDGSTSILAYNNPKSTKSNKKPMKIVERNGIYTNIPNVSW
ncbi:lytic transglycosylase domain-containing protein [Desulfurella sp.]|uniref:lytic transglycosylase domain-containing protein n=1 Tax=Desulfurella sp. TaxID=1962857 RepID=UPI0025C5BEEA|nr:lytic transglycosylase domain-containing protein [Desulfurella sp.]